MEIKRTSPRPSGFTLIELLVVITIIAVLAGIALPVFSSVQERARVTQDLNNLRQIGIGTRLYLNDHDGIYFLPSSDWTGLLHQKYIPTWRTFQSPFDRRTASDTNAPISYGFDENATVAGAALSEDRIVKPSEFILFAPSQPFTKTAGGTSITVNQDSAGPGGSTKGGTHNSGSHIDACFADLHVENMTWLLFHSDAPAQGSNDSHSARWHPDPK